MNQIQEITSTLRSLGSEERVAKSTTMFPTEMTVIGVMNPDLKIVVKELHEVMKQESRDQYLSLAYDLVSLEIIECQMLAWLLLEKAKVVPTLSKTEMHKLEGVLDNWVSVDTFGTVVFGSLWRLGIIPDVEVYALQGFENVWYRRLALVGTVALNLKSRGGIGDSRRTITVCTRAVDDHHDMIVKALSWALRSLVRWDEDAVSDFLQKHESSLHRRVIREVSHKLEFGTKN
jgi:3-methyladenine DNA glycosylase AlkD